MRAILAAFATVIVGALAILASVAATVGATLAIAFALAAPMATPCPTEDSINCYWNADTRGNGIGDSFVTWNVGETIVTLYY